MHKRHGLTDEQLESAIAAFHEAIDRAPGQTAFANICRCTQGNISQLVTNRRPLPERFVLKVEAGTGVPRHRLRPDIYPEPIDGSPPFVACDRPAVSHRERVA